MIRLEPRGKTPSYLASAEIHAFRATVREFFHRKEKTRRQERPDFPLFSRRRYAQLLEDLAALSHQKCAYCETSIATSGRGLDRFRPKAGAVGLSGDFSTEHYWWLAYEWANLYPCCLKCNKFKGAKFPVEGRRCPSEATQKQLDAEHRLLLDPFVDEPHKHLDFRDDGTVLPLSSKGEVTIHTLELNRSDLTTARANVANEVRLWLAKARWARHLDGKARTWLRDALAASALPREAPARVGDVLEILAPARPCSAVARAVVRRWVDEATPEFMAATVLPELRRAVTGRAQHGVPSPKAFGKTAKERSVSKQAQALRSRIVTRVAIKNFRGVRDLELEIDVEKGAGAPWTVLLGENATGKSSILQAIAMTLLSGDGSGAAATTPSEVITKGCKTGWVKVWLDDATEPRVLMFAKGKRRFVRTGPEYPGVLLGYGATRLLPRKSFKESRGLVRLDNMFDPFRPLIDANRWLGELDRKSFDFVARALKDVLSLPRSATLRRRRRQGSPSVELRLFGADLSLQDLSDGYQSVLGLTCDIIAGLKASSKGALEAAEGLVAIDELGAHLHPRWRMRVVESLRHAFRRVQFIVSTHDPLCLRGLENGEAIVLRRTSRNRVFSVPDLPPVKGLRVDELLTSEYFGLSSTMDPMIEQKYRELYRLLAVREPTGNQNNRIKQLRGELAPFEIPAATRRERRLLEIIDKELAQTDQEPDPEERKKIKRQSDQMVADLNRLLASGHAVV
jgi:uncharacterized protein (TIGR02646 family)